MLQYNHGDRFLGYTWYVLHQLPSTGKKIKCERNGSVRRLFEDNTSGFRQEKRAFHQNNAKVHMCVVVLTKFVGLGYELLPHPPYSPSVYFLFSNSKKWLDGKKFASNFVIVAQTTILRTATSSLITWRGLKNLRNLNVMNGEIKRCCFLEKHIFHS